MGLSFIGIRFRGGFTLIEILVVVAIIGILASVLFASFEEGRQQSRDKSRQAELKEFQLAIELYKAQNGVYPDAGCNAPDTNFAGPGLYGSGAVTTCDVYIVGLTPDYIQTLPTDPNQEQDFDKGYLYRTNADNSAYKVVVHQSVESEIVTNGNELARFVSSCGAAIPPAQYAVYSNGAECW